MSTRLYERRYPEVPGGAQNRSGVSFNRGPEMSCARAHLAAVGIRAGEGLLLLPVGVQTGAQRRPVRSLFITRQGIAREGG